MIGYADLRLFIFDMRKLFGTIPISSCRWWGISPPDIKQKPKVNPWGTRPRKSSFHKGRKWL